MLQSWKEVLPGDRYATRSKGLLHFYDQKIITQLYQPLTGIEGTSLYFTLWQELDSQAEGSETHHHLMAALNLSLDRILEARKKLEAVGLLRTLKKKDAQPAFFIYELLPPLPPQKFFTDELLHTFLYYQVGARSYQKISRLFLDRPLREDDYEDCSAAFDDVFQSLPSGELPKSRTAPDSRWRDRDRGEPPRLGKAFNFKQMEGYLSEAIVGADALTPEVREAIEKLAFIYNRDPFDMSRAVENASLHTGVVAIDELRRQVREDYRLEHGRKEKPAFYARTQPPAYREMNGREPKTDEEKTIAWFESISPYELLEELGHGSKPAAPDLRLVERLMFETKLNPGVINVLIHYISIVNDNNLNQSFVEKVAAQWSRENVKTVHEAMLLAREEHKKRKTRQQASGKNRGGVRKPAGRTRSEVVPEWMKRSGSEKSQPPLSHEEAEKRAKWLEDYVNKIY